MNEKVINMIKGDTLAFGMEFTDLDQDLDSAYFTAKQSYDSQDTVFQKSLGNGISKVSDGVYSVRVAPEDTASASAGKYYYDLQIGVNGDIFTILYGVINLYPDVTTVSPSASL